ncbi:hypothetical protein [Viridibacillus sp. FSL H8-0110]|uniref:hypothetical protein n=1 Tax=Viridibacillus sp. FSL H8-0110 TaxID=2921376 RepID=UPI0030F5BB94
MYEWLKDYKKLEEGIIYLEFNLEMNKRELDRWILGDLAKYKLSPESKGAQIEEIIKSIEWELAHKMDDLFNLKKLINTFGGLEYKILYKKYVEGKTLETIAYELGYTSGYIYNKHAQIGKMMVYAESVNAQ